MNRLLRVGIVLLAVATVWSSQLWAAAEPVPTDRLLPPEVSVYFSVPNVDDLKERFAETSMGELAKESAFEPFKAEIDKLIESLSGEIEKHLGVSLKSLLEVPSGEVAFALVTPPGKKPSAVLFLDFGDNEKTVDTLLEKAEAALTDNGAKNSDEEIDGTNVSVWSFSVNDPNKPNKLAYFVKDTLLVVTTDVETVKSILARWDGKHASTFADNDNYNLILEKCSTDDEDGLIMWYLDPMGLVRAIMTQAAAANPQVALAMGFMEPLGVNGLKAIGGSADLATEKFDGVTKTFIVVESPAKGLLNLFQFPAVEQKPPSWVSANASAWFSMNWDIAGAYSAVESMVDMFSGPGKFAATIDGLAQQEGGPKVHLKKDVIDLISGRIQVVMQTEKKKGDEEAEDRAVVALALKDAKKFQATLAKIAKVPGFPGKSREFKGSTIYEFDIPGFGVGSDQSGGLAIGLDQLLFSNNIAAIEAVLRGETDGDSLVNSPQYRRIAEHLPAKTSMVSFSHQDSQVETLWDTAKSGQFGLFLPQIDFTKLPDFEVVRKYLQPSGSYAVPDKKGVLFVSFSTKPATK